MVDVWWRGEDSNLRRHEPADLQSAPVDRFGTSPGPGGCLLSTPSLVIRRRSFHDRFAKCVRRRVIHRFVQSARSPQSRMHRPDRRGWSLHRSGVLLGPASMRRREGRHSNVQESPSTSWNLICLCLSVGRCSRSSLAWPVAPVALRPVALRPDRLATPCFAPRLTPAPSRDTQSGDAMRVPPVLLQRAPDRIRSAPHGAGEGTRTHNLRITNPVLYQLSYASLESRAQNIAEEVDPATRGKARIRTSLQDFLPPGRRPAPSGPRSAHSPAG